VLLLKPAIISTALGIYLLLLAASRPKLFAALQPLIARGSAERSARWTRAWEEQPFVRDRMRLACALAGLLLLAEAAARTVIAFYLPLGESLFLVHVPAVILAVALILIVWLLVKPAAVRAMAECGGQEAW
jgi:hypothetical protein